MSTRAEAKETRRLLTLDREHLWHPYSSMTDPGPVRLVDSAKGVRLRLADGREVIDAMSSWWCAIHGHGHPAIDAAAHRQVDLMSHVMFGGLTHRPAVELGERLLSMAPDPLRHVFFADSGSVSVEVAVKVALQAQRARGHPERTALLALRGGYHGDTFAAMSVCDPVDGMHSAFAGVLMDQVHARRPPAGLDADVADWGGEVGGLVERHRARLAGIIVEPVLQGAGGMHIYNPECVRILRALADEHGLVLIFDEIATGFGRTGTLFAANRAGVSPDIMCVGKALTGGYVTLAAMLCTSQVAQDVSASDPGILMHGPTFMANPLACAVASASLDLLAAGGWQARVDRIAGELASGLAPARESERVADVRTLGAVGVVQLRHAVDVPAVTTAALDQGVWVRPFRDLIYTMPPYITTSEEIAVICAAIVSAVDL
jgi:adenosylmethionine---8-amino-7-oxononanoate aminotransferase